MTACLFACQWMELCLQTNNVLALEFNCTTACTLGSIHTVGGEGGSGELCAWASSVCVCVFEGKLILSWELSQTASADTEPTMASSAQTTTNFITYDSLRSARIIFHFQAGDRTAHPALPTAAESSKRCSSQLAAQNYSQEEEARAQSRDFLF